MALLEVKNLSHSFGDKVLYKNVSFSLFKGEHMGLVGKNGSGKSTLLHTLLNHITPDSGEISWQKNIKIGYLDQHAELDPSITVFEYLKSAFENLYKINQKLNEIYDNIDKNCDDDVLKKMANYQAALEKGDFYEIDSKILKTAGGLGITAFGMDTKLGNLSGGQRAKVILAKLLLEKPEILLLDEPTNFLDKSHVEWLQTSLKSFNGAFIVISHDFDFLDKITTCILDIEFCKVEKYNASFSKFVKQKGIKREVYIREYEAQQKEIKKLQDYINKNKARASSAKMAKSREKMLDRIDVMEAPKTAGKPNFNFIFLETNAKIGLKVKNLEIGYTRVLLPPLDFEVKSGEHVVITGFNGIGKSTFLKTLIGQIPKISGSFMFDKAVKIGYFEQDLRWDNPSDTPFSIIKQKFPKLTDSEIRRNLANCGLKQGLSMQKIGSLSGGEQSKVKLCSLCLTPANFLILDEPTNHLDVDSKDVLKEKLGTWDGSLILVSHEKPFYKNLADRIVEIK